MLFDSHAHLYDIGKTEEENKAFMRELEKNPLISYVADIGYDLKSSERAAEDAKNYPWCFAVIGVHPHDVKDMGEETLKSLEALAEEKKVVAIGEIGLDYHYMHSPKEDQRYWFRRQIQLANKLKMPIVIHSREADQETMDILLEEGAFSVERKGWFPQRLGPEGKEEPDARVDIHCFSGSAELAKEYVKLGATLGICGPLTYKNNKKTVQVVQEIPIDYLMVETDTPYLTPVPLRGHENRPWYVEHTVRKLAEIKGLDFETAGKTTCENAVGFYGI